MTPKIYQSIILLMLLSLIGIIGVQSYGIWTAYDIEKREFERDVSQAINDLGLKVDEITSFNYNTGDSTGIDMMSPDSVTFLRLFATERFTRYVEFDTTHAFHEKRVAQVRDFFEGLQDGINLIDTSIYRERIFIIQGIECDTCETEKRFLDRYAIDSLFEIELEAQGIEMTYEMAVKDTVESNWIFFTANTDSTIALNTHCRKSGIPDEEEYLLYFYFPEESSYLYQKVQWSFMWSILLVISVFASFWYALNIIRKQKELSELKNDFINNMTHEFKTPIATISFAVANIENPLVINDPDKIRSITKIIKEENLRMNGQVEQVLCAAQASREELQFKHEELNAHEIINQVSDAAELKINQLGGTFSRRLNAGNAVLMGDSFHLSNAIANLLDNAQKYSKDKLDISLQTESQSDGFWLQIKDSGIGIAKDAQSKIFDRFYRVSTGNLHNVKGFGLGLSYVKTVIDAHGGSINVESTKGTGSTFHIFLPFNPQST